MLEDNSQGILQGIFNFFCSPAPTSSPSSSPSLSPTMIPAFKIDKDGDGKISEEEFDGYLKKINFRQKKNHSEFDEDGDGKFTFEEMVKMTTGRPQGNHSNYEGNPFDIDTDGSGTISKKELDIFWSNFGINFTKEDKRAHMRAYDLDGDGEITEEEFSTALTTSHGKMIVEQIRSRVTFDTPCPTKSQSPTAPPTATPSPTATPVV